MKRLNFVALRDGIALECCEEGSPTKCDAVKISRGRAVLMRVVYECNGFLCDRAEIEVVKRVPLKSVDLANISTCEDFYRVWSL